MIEFTASYYDGTTSSRTDVVVIWSISEGLSFTLNDSRRRYACADIRFSSRLGNTPRLLDLPDGARLETQDNEAIDSILKVLNTKRFSRFIHRLESRFRYVAAALVGTVLVMWLGIQYGLPYLANHVARTLPVQLETSMGERTLSSFDGSLTLPTRLMEVDRERVRDLFGKAIGDLPFEKPPRLELRRSKVLGANAFALPSGILVITDDLVELAGSDQELLAVIAHELGHVHHRHIMRAILQNSVAALLVATVFGDLGSISSLAATLPTLLLERGYSRRFELEADAYSASYLRSLGIDPQVLGVMLKRLMQAHGMNDSRIGGYLATHPAVEQRIDAATKTH